MSPGRARKSEGDEPAQPQKDSERVPRTLYLDKELLDRARAAAVYLQAYEPDANIRSLSDIFEPGAWKTVAELEKKFNEGKPFKPVRGMSRGRPAGQ